MATNSIKILTGTSHRELAQLIADRLGIELAKIVVVKYANNESSITIGESVRDEDGMSTVHAQHRLEGMRAQQQQVA